MRVTTDLVKKVKIETSDSDIKPELEDSKCFSLNVEDHLMKFNETIKETEIETKIDIKEEHWWLEREDLCVHDDIKDGTQENTYATKLPSLYKEEVSTYTSNLSSTGNLENDVGFNMNRANAECGKDRECQVPESAVADICSIETDVCSETSDDGKIVNMAFCLKQSKLIQQCNTNEQNVNKKCKSILSNECRKSYKCDVSKKCVKYSFHLKKCRLAFDRKKVDKCGVLNKGLYQLSLKTHKCNICDKSCTCLQRLKTHEGNHKGINPHKCNTCNKAFTRVSHLKDHKLIHDGIKQHQCNICNKAFIQLANLNRHTMIHEGIKPHRCNICNKGLVKHHKLIHEGIKPHKCNTCNKAFTRVSHLKDHKLIHDGIKQHQCNICNKAFIQLTNLNRHIMIHEAIKPHKCNICNKGFIEVKHLKDHKLTHEGIKPHKCNICNKAFTRLSDLKKHSFIHEGKRPHKCNICNKDFAQLSDLKRHKLIHDGIKPHKCNICKKDFSQSSSLKRHKLIHQDTIA